MTKNLVSIAVGLVLASSASAFAAGGMSRTETKEGAAPEASAPATGMSQGEVKKVDAAAGKLTIKHGPLENLGMDAMTMVFRVKDPTMLQQVAIGDKIDFVAEQVNGALTVTKLQKSQ